MSRPLPCWDAIERSEEHDGHGWAYPSLEPSYSEYYGRDVDEFHDLPRSVQTPASVLEQTEDRKAA